MEEKNVFYTCKNDRAFKEVFMKEENIDISTIARITGLTQEEIEKL